MLAKAAKDARIRAEAVDLMTRLLSRKITAVMGVTFVVK